MMVYILSSFCLFWLISFACYLVTRPQTGLLERRGRLIYKDENKKQLFGLQKVDGKTFYFDAETGYAYTGFKNVNNKTYYFNEEGEVYSGLKKIDEHTYYFNEDGSVLKKSFKDIEIDGVKERAYFDQNGQMLQNQMKNLNGVEIKFNEKGIMEFDTAYLKKEIEKIMEAYGGDSSFYFKDLSTGKTISIHDTPFYPCCMIKVPALAAVYQAIEDGKIKLEDNLEYMRYMITISDNTSYNKLMRRVGNGKGLNGLKVANEICKKAGLKDTELHHGLKPGKSSFSDGKRNVSSAKDSGIFFEALYNGEVVSKESSQQMIDLLMQCNDTTHLVQGMPYGTKFAHKTGCTESYYHDGGIVYLPEGRDYILVVYSKDVENHEGLMIQIAQLLYDYEMAFTVEE